MYPFYFDNINYFRSDPSFRSSFALTSSERHFFILKDDGTSLFCFPYREDFIFHCLLLLLDRSDQHYRLLEFVPDQLSFSIFSIRSRSDIFALQH